MLTDSIKITSKGQITIPSEVRNILKTNVIVFEILDGEVSVKPVKSVAGSLKKYNKNFGSFSEIREKAWKEVFDGRKE